jgi:hypothetical protein
MKTLYVTGEESAAGGDARPSSGLPTANLNMLGNQH